MPIAFTPGEPSGIGPDIAIIYAQKKQKEDLLVYCDPDVLIDRAKNLNLPITLKESESKNASELSIYPIKTSNKVIPGRLNPANSNYVLETIKQATKDCLNGNCDGLLTGPVNNPSQFPFRQSFVACFTVSSTYTALLGSSFPGSTLLIVLIG